MKAPTPEAPNESIIHHLIFADCDTSNLDANLENVFFILHSLHIVRLNPLGYAFVKRSNLEVSLICGEEWILEICVHFF